LIDTAQRAVVEARAVAKSYGGLRAVDGVSFVVGAGEVLGIAGPNGAGKTTLFDVLGGHVEASGGEILLAGEDITRASIHHRCRLGLARTFQQPTVAASLTVLENAYVAARYRRERESRSRADDVAAAQAQLQRLGLGGLEGRVAGSLPVYDRKRLMLATALATNPRALLLDEPFAGLNPAEIDATIAVLHGVRDEGVAVVCVEHVMRALVALSGRVLVMHHGAQIFLGTPDEMLRDERVIDVYLGARARRAS
jgi:branched-chain amino acid transport system ATP-binding protein